MDRFGRVLGLKPCFRCFSFSRRSWNFVFFVETGSLLPRFCPSTSSIFAELGKPPSKTPFPFDENTSSSSSGFLNLDWSFLLEFFSWSAYNFPLGILAPVWSSDITTLTGGSSPYHQYSQGYRPYLCPKFRPLVMDSVLH